MDGKKKGLSQHIIKLRSLTQFFERCQARIFLNTHIIVKNCMLINEMPGCKLVTVNALGFENREEIFRHCIVITVSASWHRKTSRRRIQLRWEARFLQCPFLLVWGISAEGTLVFEFAYTFPVKSAEHARNAIFKSSQCPFLRGFVRRK